MSMGANFRLAGGSDDCVADVGGVASSTGFRRLLLVVVSIGMGGNLDLGFAGASADLRLLVVEVSIGCGVNLDFGFGEGSSAALWLDLEVVSMG